VALSNCRDRPSCRETAVGSSASSLALVIVLVAQLWPQIETLSCTSSPSTRRPKPNHIRSRSACAECQTFNDTLGICGDDIRGRLEPLSKLGVGGPAVPVELYRSLQPPGRASCCLIAFLESSFRPCPAALRALRGQWRYPVASSLFRGALTKTEARGEASII